MEGFAMFIEIATRVGLIFAFSMVGLSIFMGLVG